MQRKSDICGDLTTINADKAEGAIIIGHIKRDMHATERQHAERYALDNADGVRLLLADYHALVQRQYAGDYDAVIILADLQRAIDMAALTWRQKSALHYVFIAGYDQREAAKLVGITEQTFGRLIERATTNIAAIFEYWAHRDEGYHVTNLIEAEETKCN